MTFLRSLLMVLFAIMMLYTLVVISRDGIGFLPAFIGDILSLGWRGQFNLDFASYLLLSAVWLAWRSGFSGSGIATALISFLGMTVLAPILLVLLARSGGDIRKLLLGVHA